MQTKKPKILTFTSYYLPGYKSGGAPRTVMNMVEHLNEQFEFWIVTRDRDLGDHSQYPGIEANQWLKIGNAHIYYVAPAYSSIRTIAQIISQTPHDLLYLNSFFDLTFTAKPLLASKICRSLKKPIIIAPRGELSPAALRIKRIRKSVYLACFRLARLHRQIVFQASTKIEAEEMADKLGVSAQKIEIAVDLPKKVSNPGTLCSSRAPHVSAGILKVIFLSRIVPIKNLDYALQVLAQVTKKRVEFDIYGPQEDPEYWKTCEELISNLPENICARYKGNVLPSDVQNIFSLYDLFFFPTQGENYGHVIAESLSVGTPVLISDRTPWLNLDAEGLGWELPLYSLTEFVKKIESLDIQTDDLRCQRRRDVQHRAIARLLNPAAIQASRKLFDSLLNDNRQHSRPTV